MRTRSRLATRFARPCREISAAAPAIPKSCKPSSSRRRKWVDDIASYFWLQRDWKNPPAHPFVKGGQYKTRKIPLFEKACPEPSRREGLGEIWTRVLS